MSRRRITLKLSFEIDTPEESTKHLEAREQMDIASATITAATEYFQEAPEQDYCFAYPVVRPPTRHRPPPATKQEPPRSPRSYKALPVLPEPYIAERTSGGIRRTDAEPDVLRLRREFVSRERDRAEAARRKLIVEWNLTADQRREKNRQKYKEKRDLQRRIDSAPDTYELSFAELDTKTARSIRETLESESVDACFPRCGEPIGFKRK